MKMGLERKLKERIPEICEVIQTIPDAPQLNEANIEQVLDGVRPFLSVAGIISVLEHASFYLVVFSCTANPYNR